MFCNDSFYTVGPTHSCQVLLHTCPTHPCPLSGDRESISQEIRPLENRKLSLRCTLLCAWIYDVAKQRFLRFIFHLALLLFLSPPRQQFFSPSVSRRLVFSPTKTPRGILRRVQQLTKYMFKSIKRIVVQF